jgi:hypothetical protein
LERGEEMKFSEIGHRINGFGIATPIFGVSLNWDPPEPTRSIARKVIIFLENRRVLYDLYDMEDMGYCVQSIIEIRHFLTDQIIGSSSDDLEKNLRAMRAACIKFLGRVDIPPASRNPKHSFRVHLTLIDALAELRTTFGLYIGILAAKYGIDIEENLAKILPAHDNDNNE